MNRRKFMTLTSHLASAALLAELVDACGSASSPTVPTPTAPNSVPSVQINPDLVGELKYTISSPVNGTLYDAFLNTNGPAISTSNISSVDTLTGRAFKGLEVVSVNGDLGPSFIDRDGKQRYCGWVIGVGDLHGFYNSITDVKVTKGTPIDLYHGRPCSDPNKC